MGNSSWTLAPYLRVDGARSAIDWYARALGATETSRYEMPDGKIGHAELDVHGNLLCLADTSAPGQFAQPRSYNDLPIILFAVVADVDAVFNRAVEAGARIERPLADQPYGDRNGGFIDPYGHVWYVSMPLPATVAAQ